MSEETQKVIDSLITKQTLLHNFPFTPRGNQEWLLDQLLTHLNDPNKKFIVIQAPTGAGKSAISVALARCFKKSFILTANKFLQDQYERDFGHLMKSLKGRSNYSCYVTKGKNCAEAPCRASASGRASCGKDVKCQYHIERDAAATSDMALMNFSAGIAYLNYTPFFPKRDILIIDEAHLLESQLTGFVGFTLDDNDLIEVGLLDRGQYLPKYDDVGQYIHFLKNMHMKATVAVAGGKKNGGAIIDKLESYERKLNLLVQELESNPANLVMTHGFHNQGYLNKITFQPLNVSRYSEGLVFKHADKVIMLSATILNAKSFARSLGIPEESFVYIDVPSTFPKENRPILVPAIENFNQSNLQANIPQIVKVIEAIASRHPDVKGIIHVPSYQLANDLYSRLHHLQNRLIYPEKSTDQQKAVYVHEVDPRPTILLSPSMAEGVDLKDDLSRFQIIVKVPYPSLGDRLVKARMDNDRSWYPTQTLLKLVQSYGRSVRTETDHAVTYVLDGNFHRLVDQNRHILPKWFLEAIK